MKLRVWMLRCFAEDCEAAKEERDVEAMVEVTDEDPTVPAGDAPRCEECGAALRRVPSAPTVLKVSYHDGHRRQDSWYLAKEAAAIRRREFELPPSQRGELAKERKRLEKEAFRRWKPED